MSLSKRELIELSKLLDIEEKMKHPIMPTFKAKLDGKVEYKPPGKVSIKTSRKLLLKNAKGKQGGGYDMSIQDMLNEYCNGQEYHPPCKMPDFSSDEEEEEHSGRIGCGKAKINPKKILIADQNPYGNVGIQSKVKNPRSILIADQNPYGDVPIKVKESKKNGGKALIKKPLKKEKVEIEKVSSKNRIFHQIDRDGNIGSSYSKGQPHQAAKKLFTKLGIDEGIVSIIEATPHSQKKIYSYMIQKIPYTKEETIEMMNADKPPLFIPKCKIICKSI